MSDSSRLVVVVMAMAGLLVPRCAIMPPMTRPPPPPPPEAQARQRGACVAVQRGAPDGRGRATWRLQSSSEGGGGGGRRRRGRDGGHKRHPRRCQVAHACVAPCCFMLSSPV